MKSYLLFLIVFIPQIIYSNVNEKLYPGKTNKQPVIDGVLDDDMWQNSPTVTGFTTFIPDFAKPMKEKTVVYMGYDEENLYFAFRCFDSEPDKIKASVTNRDNIRSEDWVCLNIDTFGDQQSLCAFYINPFGVQADARYANEEEDEGIDFIWYSGGKIDENGYVTEIQIPLSSIRYTSNSPVTMRVFFERKISRYSEQGSYPNLDPDMGYSFFPQMATLVYEDLAGEQVFEILPAVTYNHTYANTNGTLENIKSKENISLTTKYGITSNLILDATYNPDFSQVESDASEVEVNLRSSIYYPEKRSFFLEGRENFNISGLKSSELDPLQNIIHSRSIISPLFGLKLTGNLTEKDNIASIYAIDDLEKVFNKDTANSHYTIFRYRHALEGDSYLGGIYAGKELKGYFNRVFGLDGLLRMDESSYLSFNGLISATKPGDQETDYNNSVTLKYYKQTRDFDYSFTAQNISKEFNAEMGYVKRNGLRMLTGLYKPKFYTEGNFIQRIDVEMFASVSEDLYFNKYETFNHLSAQVLFGGTYQVKVKYSYSTEVFAGELFKTGGFHVFAAGHFTNNLYAGILYRNRSSILYSNPTQGRSNVVSASLIYHPTSNLVNELSFVYSDFTRSSDSKRIYDVPITRYKLTYQFNRYLFLRGILEYNNYDKSLSTDFLASFTYIPGTVIHIGYGSLYEKIQWRESFFVPSDKYLETRRGLFIKMSYLWRV